MVLWTANTERYSNVVVGLNDTSDNLFAAVDRDEAEISPSTLYALACVLEGVPFINGSPQNTFVPGTIQLQDTWVYDYQDFIWSRLLNHICSAWCVCVIYRVD